MKVTQTALRGVLIIEPDVFADERGFFVESYNRARYAEHAGLDVEFVQDNHSHSKANVLRGLHLQRRYPQGKLIRVVSGHVWDVAVDVDPRSPTFRQWVGVDLTDANHLQLYIPPGYRAWLLRAVGSCRPRIQVYGVVSSPTTSTECCGTIRS